MRYKKTFLLMAMLFLLVAGGQALAAESSGNPVQQQVLAVGSPNTLNQQQGQNVPTDGVEAYWNQLMRDYGGYFPDSRMPTFKELIASHGFSLKRVLSGLLNYFFHEVIVGGRLLATIVALAVFSMILETLQTAFEKQSVSKIAYSICYLVLMVLAVNSFNLGIGYAKAAIAGMVNFMMALVPLLLSLVGSMGNVASVTVLHPFIIFMIHAVSTLIYVFVFPLLFFSTLLSIVSSISERFKVTQLAKLLRNVGVGILGLAVTVFLGVLSVQGATSAVTDGVTLRAAKYVAGNFIPVVGRMFTDASDTVIGASLLVKNTIGLAGVLIVILICAFPALKIMALAFIYQIAAAIIQPLGDSPIIGCLQTIGKNMMYVFAALAAVGLMFFLAITIMIAAGNVSLMMR
ncbi:stage III sporulation protein AE [Gorillibacterium timonense]|uniref:stage III sporulation protein AE n=1 Tax=Gorillibacterium timonense TaxID=1689269 RepID=UPI000A7C3833|nr:stage III sporulation protein AE [Gorillibacterium timonense]